MPCDIEKRHASSILRNRFICIHFLSLSAVQTRAIAISYTQNVSPSVRNSFGTALEQRHCQRRRNEAMQNLPRHPPPPFLHPHPCSSASTTLSAHNTNPAPLQLQPQYRTQPDQHSIPEVGQSHVFSEFSTDSNITNSALNQRSPHPAIYLPGPPNRPNDNFDPIFAPIR